MAKNDQQEAYEKALTNLLQRILDNQKFAETKNAALLTFCSAWILAAIAQTIHATALPDLFDKVILIALPFFVTGALIAVVSFLPSLNLFKMSGGRDAKSLLFFGHIADMTATSFAADIRRAYYPEENQSATEAYLKALETQIFVNSDITNRKHRLFKWGAGITVFGVLILAMPLFIRLAGMIAALYRLISDSYSAAAAIACSMGSMTLV